MMTNLITLTIPNDDSTALYHFGKSLIDMSASVSGVREFVVITRDEYEALVTTDVTCKLSIDSTDISAEVDKIIAQRANIQVDTTPQQVESLGEAVLTINGVGIDSEPVSDEEITGCDKSGTPWDERIHSTSKALNADGTWRLRRKPKDMDEAEWLALVESVKTELQQPININHVSIDPSHEESELQPPLYEVSPGHIGVMQPEPPVTPPGDDFHTDADVVTEQTVAGIPPLPVPPPVVVAQPVPVIPTGEALDVLASIPVITPEQREALVNWDFPRLMTFLTERHGKIDVATVNTLLAQDGIATLTDLNAHPDKIGPFVARVKAHLGE